MRLALLLALFLVTAAHAITLEGRVKVHVLKNGMTFLLLERHHSPTVACYMKFRVGGVDEHLGIIGTAHLLEHMLFKGTHTLGTKDWPKEEVLLRQIDVIGEDLDSEQLKAVPDKAKVESLSKTLKELEQKARQLAIKDEIDEIYSKAGAVGFNASTTHDMTTYTVSLPANRLELWARIEADRMKHPVLREYYSERDVVMEERRMRTDSNPNGTLWEQFTRALFIAHPYGIPVVGWMSEIKHLSKLRTEQFRRTYYAPNNTVVALVGDLKVDEVLPLLEKYFGSIPQQELPRPPAVEEPEQIGERHIEVEQDASPSVLIGYHKPNLPHQDDYVFDLISGLLTDGRSSRLYRRLVKELQLAISVDSSSSFPGNRFPNVFILSATPRAPHTAQEVEEAIHAELENMKKTPVTKRDLEKVNNKLEADFLRGLSSNEGLASQLSEFQMVAGDWHYILTHSGIVRKVTPEEIQQVCKKYFKRSNRTVAVMVRRAQAGGAQ